MSQEEEQQQAEKDVASPEHACWMTARFQQAWSTTTTRLLLGTTASSCWSVWDEPMGCGDNNNINLGRQMLQELTPLLARLRPARTAGDALRHEAMDIWRRHWLLLQTNNDNNDASAEPWPRDDADAAAAATTTTTRGDRALFLTQQEPEEESLCASSCPTVRQYVHAVQRVVAARLGHALELDLTRTSWQLAEYAGDGRAAYPRHCDVSGACRGSGSGGDDHPTTSTTTHHHHATAYRRLLTVLYYLTPDDWDATRDGGALRIHHNNDNEDEYTDVIPYANRMVIFRADCVPHQVRPSLRRPRRALTLWIYGRIKQQQQSLPLSIPPWQEPLVTTSTSKPATTVDTASTPSSTPNNNNNNDIMALVSAWLNPPTGGPPPLDITHPQDKQPSWTIFVSMAAFRDSQVGPTIVDLRAKALHPDRIFVGLVLQVTPDDKVGLPNQDDNDDASSSSWYTHHVRTVSMPARHAKGPCPARAMAQLLYRREDYVLQIDAHMRFRENWDAYLVQELDACPHADKALLTTYPVGYQLPNIIPHETRGTYLYACKFDDKDGMLRQKARFFDTPPPRPVATALFAAGFCFGRSAWLVRDCPYDGSLHDLFFGEEMSMAVRLFTAGYDLYAPRETVCYHLWSRAHRPPGNPIDPVARRQSQEKVLQQLQGVGVGIQRSVQEWATAVGIDLEHGRVIQHKEAASDRDGEIHATAD